MNGTDVQIEFRVRRDDFAVSQMVETNLPPIAEGSVRIRLDLFGLTSNNITYAAMGEGPLGYWDFFPTEEGWGRPPCWGFGAVVASRAAGLTSGDRVYGYFPIGTHLDVKVARGTPESFFDAAPHRRPKSPVYNQYLRTSADPAYVAGRESEQVLFRPLFATGWWLADFIRHWESPPQSVVMSSASSKTALATAHQLQGSTRAELIGLTGTRHLEYVRSTGLFDRVCDYNDTAHLQTGSTKAFLDFRGDENLTAAVHARLGPELLRSIVIGATDWSAKPGGIQIPRRPLAGVSPEFFFAPGYAGQRLNQDGDGLQAKAADAQRAFYAVSHAFVQPRRSSGPAAIDTSWSRLLAAEVPPDEGLVLAW
jgi:hypothetical protein